MIPYEENIMRMFEVCAVVHMAETSDWNPDGITEEEARSISYRNHLGLNILESAFLPTLRVFEFKSESLDCSVKQNNREGGLSEKTNH